MHGATIKIEVECVYSAVGNESLYNRYVSSLHRVKGLSSGQRIRNGSNNTNFGVGKHAAWNSIHNCLFYKIIFLHDCLTLGSLKAMTP
jgi:hypothetical protein